MAIKSSGWIQWIALGLCLAWLSWLGTLATRFSSPTSPDEAANRLMAKHWATSNSFQYPTELSPAQLAVFHPRSLAIHGSELRPGSFLGFPMLLGWTLKFGSAGPIIFTLLVSLAAVAAWFRIGRRYWEWPWALLACGLLCSLPVLITHQVIPYTQPALYLGFLILTGLALLRYQEQPTAWRAVMVGLAYGAALFIRPVEVLFTGPIIAVVMLAHRKQWPIFLLTVAVTLALQVPWILVGQKTFGAPLASGYTTEGISVSSTSAGLPIWKALLTPAGGVWSWNFIQNARDYLLLLYPALSAMTFVAIGMYFKRKFVDPKKIIKIGAVVLFIGYYLAYYGSWNLYPDVPASRIGSAASYTRYWIPLYVAMVAGTIVFLRRTFSSLRSLAAPILFLAIGVNLWTWWYHPSGYRNLITESTTTVNLKSTLVQITESNSLIIAGQYEKTLLGARLTSFAYPKTTADWNILSSIVAQRPVYILGLDAPVSAKQLAIGSTEAGLTLVDVSHLDGQPVWRIQAVSQL